MFAVYICSFYLDGLSVQPHEERSKVCRRQRGVACSCILAFARLPNVILPQLPRSIQEQQSKIEQYN